MRASFLGGFLLCAWMMSCHFSSTEKAPDPAANRASLLEADKAFSRLCETKGVKEAYIENLDSNAVLLRAGHKPITGADVIDYLIQQNDSGYSLSWQPAFAEVAASGDLGYTYGMYSLHMKTRDSSVSGTYVSIWKKHSNGKWKFALDTGNEGTGNE